MIHGDNPFVDAPERRDPVRRFRGRLAAPVTIVTAGRHDSRTGLTVSSLSVVEGPKGFVQLVVGTASDLWRVIHTTRRFIIHICHESDRDIAEVFAGMRPSPGGMFAEIDVLDSPHGPVIDRLGNRASCRFLEGNELGFSGIVTGELESVETDAIDDPLIYFRGRYGSLVPPRA